MANPKDHNKFESSGKPLKGVQIGIFDSNFSRLPNCSIGRIGMVIPGMANEYYKNPTQTAARFNNGWFFPGDTGFIQDDGSIVILAREDETIIMNGLNIFPKEIEQVLEAHPDVSNAVAVGIESRVHGTIPVAAVVLKPDVNLNPNELLLWSKELLALKSPKKIIVISKIPKSPEGKVLRKKVLDFFEIKSKKKVN
jgi:long-chain acyl-CoA synthetase